MSDNGWVKLHRKLLDNPLMRKPAYRSVWIELLLRATHNGSEVMFGGQRTKLEPGQFTTGTWVIAEATGVPRATVARILKAFENEQQIEQRTDRQCSLITIKKWKEYQTDEQRNEQRVSNDRATSEQRLSTKQECKNEKNERMKEPDSEVALRAPTPADEAKGFFTSTEHQDQVLGYLITKGVEETMARHELGKFISYWTEPTRSGKKQRWETEKTFEIRRRLVTWFGNVNKRGGHINSQPKGMTL